MDQIERIKRMEEISERSSLAIQNLTAALTDYEKIVKELKKLSDYYGSANWVRDYEDDEKGKFPADMKRGVLSEDGIYDILMKNREAVKLMGKLVDYNLSKEIM